jgi:hypothetical protein
MKRISLYLVNITIAILVVLPFHFCKKLKELKQEPELESLRMGLKTSAAIGYCASIAVSAYKGMALPENVTYNRSTGLIYIKIDESHPLPFNKNVGDIIIAGIWQTNGGVISILFADIDLIDSDIKLYGLHTVPIIEREGEGITTMFAKQDVVLGYGSDTVLDLSNITNPVFNTELDRLNDEKPTDAFVAVKQNVWFINIDQSGTNNNVLDDNIVINGGGQILEVKGESGGIVYHAMIDTKINYSVCSKNPISGNALSQNFKAGGSVFLDLGNSFLSFHNSCDGMAHVDFSTGKYVWYNNKNISLGL